MGPDAGTVTVLAALLVSFGLTSTAENVMVTARNADFQTLPISGTLPEINATPILMGLLGPKL
ncbi:hypothetical protein LP421_00475 (plasmid) [Rhizobium sp. RCAM05350]|nr:hypothetical protein LP421_00475 [Rhizobium sp. RCAM05350]